MLGESQRRSLLTTAQVKPPVFSLGYEASSTLCVHQTATPTDAEGATAEDQPRRVAGVFTFELERVTFDQSGQWEELEQAPLDQAI